jgi:hypothetical protein
LAGVSFIAFTSFRPIHSFNLISLCNLPGDDPEGALEVEQNAETGQVVVDVDGIHGTPP